MTTTVSPVGSTGLLEVMLGLAFVVLLIVGLAWLFKRLGGATLGAGGLIKIHAAISVGNRDRIALIAVGEKQMLIGLSPGRISTLHVFDEPPVLPERLMESAQRFPAEGNGNIDFAHKLQKALSGFRS